jgi:hypothetical protein
MFQYFGQRLKRDLKQLVDRRLELSVISSGSVQKVGFHSVFFSFYLSNYDSRPVSTSMSSATNARDMRYGSAVLSLHLS